MDWMKAGRNHPVGQWHLRRQEFAERGMDISRFIDPMNDEFVCGVLFNTHRYLFSKRGVANIARRRLDEYEEWYQSWTPVEYDGENASEVYQDKNLASRWEYHAAEARGRLKYIRDSIPEYLRCLRWYSNQPELAGVVELHKMIIDDIIEKSGWVRPKTNRRRKNEPRNVFKIRS